MHRLLTTTILAVLMSSVAAVAEDIKIGIFLGFTGPLESLVAQMGPSAELAIKEANDSGKFLNGAGITSVRGDTTCIDSTSAVATIERLITSERVAGIVGGDCSGITIAALTGVARPNGMVMIAPSTTSPALSTIEDNGLFFRVAPSDARQGVVMTEVIMDRGYSTVALTYTNNDYGKGLADAFEHAFAEAGGSVTISAPHEDGKADYAAEVGALAAAGGEVLVVAGYLDQGGKGIIGAALDTGAFDTFVLPAGMVGASLPEAIGPDLDGSFGQTAGTNSPGVARFIDLLASSGIDATSPYAAESYDAAALLLLAMQAAGSTDPNVYKHKVFDVANGPGVKIMPGELGKAFDILTSGGQIDYDGASNVELIGAGESAGNYREIEIKGGEVTTVRYR